MAILQHMDDYVFMKKNMEIEKLGAELGFSRTHFLEDDFVLLKSKTQKDLLKEAQAAKQKKLKTIFRAESEEMLRFALERSQVDIVYGMENVHPKDSLHFVRGGLDQVLCKIAAEKGKILAFSFSDILNSANKSKLLARILFNMRLCKKYKVPILWCSFAASREELRSAKDLQALGRILGI
jgi:RNase P/RNase MRP subunit p30